MGLATWTTWTTWGPDVLRQSSAAWPSQNWNGSFNIFNSNWDLQTFTILHHPSPFLGGEILGVSRTDVHHHGMVHTSTSSGAAVNSEGAPLVSIVSIVSAVSAVSALGQDGRALEKDQKTQLPSLDDANDFKTF